jgi:Fe-S cluster assembly protein SufB
MSTDPNQLANIVGQKYRHGFVTDIEQETVPPGLDEDVIRLISAKKGEPPFMTDWRLKAYRHWLTMQEPNWAHVHYAPIDFQSISYYSAPKNKDDAPKSLDEVDPKLLETYEKLGIPLHERARLAGVAVDAVFDSVSVATTFKGKLAEAGVIFCSFSEAVRSHPELVQKYLGSVVPHRDNFFAALNSAVFSDGSFVYIPKGVRCPMENKLVLNDYDVYKEAGGKYVAHDETFQVTVNDGKLDLDFISIVDNAKVNGIEIDYLG